MTPTSIPKGPIFLDTSALYAARDRSDRNYRAAVDAFRRLEEEGALLLTTDHVIAEAATLIRRKLGYEEVQAFLYAVKEARATGLLTLHFVAADDLEAAEAYFLATADPKLSLVDALSVIVCRRKGIGRALAFDDHFRQAGLEPVGPLPEL